jgi:hypothetical protein
MFAIQGRTRMNGMAYCLNVTGRVFFWSSPFLHSHGKTQNPWRNITFIIRLSSDYDDFVTSVQTQLTTDDQLGALASGFLVSSGRVGPAGDRIHGVNDVYIRTWRNVGFDLKQSLTNHLPKLELNWAALVHRIDYLLVIIQGLKLGTRRLEPRPA